MTNDNTAEQHGQEVARSFRWQHARSVIEPHAGSRRSVLRWVHAIDARQRASLASQRVSRDLPSERFGICCFHTVSVVAEPARPAGQVAMLRRGDSYRVAEHDKRRGWLRIEEPAGWICSAEHHGITAGEYKVLSSAEREVRTRFSRVLLRQERQLSDQPLSQVDNQAVQDCERGEDQTSGCREQQD